MDLTGKSRSVAQFHRTLQSKKKGCAIYLEKLRRLKIVYKLSKWILKVGLDKIFKSFVSIGIKRNPENNRAIVIKEALSSLW